MCGFGLTRQGRICERMSQIQDEQLRDRPQEHIKNIWQN